MVSRVINLLQESLRHLRPKQQQFFFDIYAPKISQNSVEFDCLLKYRLKTLLALWDSMETSGARLFCQENFAFINSHKIFVPCYLPNRTRWQSTYFLSKYSHFCQFNGFTIKSLCARYKISFSLPFENFLFSSSMSDVDSNAQSVFIYLEKKIFQKIRDDCSCIGQNLYANFYSILSLSGDY